MNRRPAVVTKPPVRKGQAKESVYARLMIILMIAMLSPVLLAFKVGMKLQEVYGR